MHRAKLRVQWGKQRLGLARGEPADRAHLRRRHLPTAHDTLEAQQVHRACRHRHAADPTEAEIVFADLAQRGYQFGVVAGSLGIQPVEDGIAHAGDPRADDPGARRGGAPGEARVDDGHVGAGTDQMIGGAGPEHAGTDDHGTHQAHRRGPAHAMRPRSCARAAAMTRTGVPSPATTGVKMKLNRMASPFAGMTQIRFDGCDLSPDARAPR